jgi:enoyl reductase-like protein
MTYQQKINRMLELFVKMGDMQDLKSWEDLAKAIINEVEGWKNNENHR